MMMAQSIKSPDKNTNTNQSNIDLINDLDNPGLLKEGSMMIDPLTGNLSNNVKKHINTVETLHEEAVQTLVTIKREADILRQEIHLLQKTATKHVEGIGNIIAPTSENIIRQMRININAQKDENASLQMQITELRKENSALQQIILLTGQKLAKLEEVVGSYREKN